MSNILYDCRAESTIVKRLLNARQLLYAVRILQKEIQLSMKRKRLTKLLQVNLTLITMAQSQWRLVFQSRSEWLNNYSSSAGKVMNLWPLPWFSTRRRFPYSLLENLTYGIMGFATDQVLRSHLNSSYVLSKVLRISLHFAVSLGRFSSALFLDHCHRKFQR